MHRHAILDYIDHGVELSQGLLLVLRGNLGRFVSPHGAEVDQCSFPLFDADSSSPSENVRRIVAEGGVGNPYGPPR